MVMYILISLMYFVKAPDQILLKGIIFIITAIFVYNHFFQYDFYKSKIKLSTILIDGMLCFIYGFLFPSSTLYFILVGVTAITLFLSEFAKKVRHRLLWGSFFLWVIVMIECYVRIGYVDLFNNLTGVSFVVFGTVVGDLIRKLYEASEVVTLQYEHMSRSHKELEDAHQQLQQYAQTVEQLTVDRERNRIAREIHDTVGHKMTALLVQLQLARELMKQDRPKAETALSICGVLARDALEEVRFSVKTIHSEEGSQQTFTSSVRKLFEDFHKSAGLQTTFDLAGDPASIPSTLQPTLIRIIQESMTNAKRHGQATLCHVILSCTKEKITLTIKDNGCGISKVTPGFGLINMKERIEEHGGTVFFQSILQGGFEIDVELPLHQKRWIIGGAS